MPLRLQKVSEYLRSAFNAAWSNMRYAVWQNLQLGAATGVASRDANRRICCGRPGHRHARGARGGWVEPVLGSGDRADGRGTRHSPHGHHRGRCRGSSGCRRRIAGLAEVTVDGSPRTLAPERRKARTSGRPKRRCSASERSAPPGRYPTSKGRGAQCAGPSEAGHPSYSVTVGSRRTGKPVTSVEGPVSS